MSLQILGEQLTTITRSWKGTQWMENSSNYIENSFETTDSETAEIARTIFRNAINELPYKVREDFFIKYPTPLYYQIDDKTIILVSTKKIAIDTKIINQIIDASNFLFCKLQLNFNPVEITKEVGLEEKIKDIAVKDSSIVCYKKDKSVSTTDTLLRRIAGILKMNDNLESGVQIPLMKNRVCYIIGKELNIKKFLNALDNLKIDFI